MATFLEMQDRVLDGTLRAGLTDRTEVRSLLNQALLEINAKYRGPTTSYTANLTNGVADYSLTTLVGVPLVTVRSIIYSGTNYTGYNPTLEPTTAQDIYEFRTSTQSATGAMRYYALPDPDKLMVYPTPVTGDQINIIGTPRPTTMASDGDIPTAIPVEFHDVIVLGALSKAMRVTSPALARDYRLQFIDGLMELRKYRNQHDSSLPKVAIVGSTRNRRNAFHDNSQYFSGDNR